MTTSCFGAVFMLQVLRCALHEPCNAMQAWETILIALTGNAAVLATLAYPAKLFVGHKLSWDVSSFQSELKATSAAAIERLKSDLQHWKDGQLQDHTRADKNKAWNEGWEAIRNDIPAARRTLENEFRAILNGTSSLAG